jgi:hypothetical protein
VKVRWKVRELCTTQVDFGAIERGLNPEFCVAAVAESQPSRAIPPYNDGDLESIPSPYVRRGEIQPLRICGWHSWSKRCTRS